MNAEEIFECVREWRGSHTACSVLLNNTAAVNLLAASSLAPHHFTQVPIGSSSSPCWADDDDDGGVNAADGDTAAALSVKKAKLDAASSSAEIDDDTQSIPPAAQGSGRVAVAPATATSLVLRSSCCGVETTLEEPEREALASLEMHTMLLRCSDEDVETHAARDGVLPSKRTREDGSTAVACSSQSGRYRHIVHTLLCRAHDASCLRCGGLPVLRFLFGVQSLSLRDSLLVRARCAATEGDITIASAGSAPSSTRTVWLLPRATPPVVLRAMTTPSLAWFGGQAHNQLSSSSCASSSAAAASRVGPRRLCYRGSNTHPLILTSLLRLKRPRDTTSTAPVPASPSPAPLSQSPPVSAVLTPLPHQPAPTTHTPENDEEARKVAHQVVLLMHLHGFGVAPRPVFEKRLDAVSDLRVRDRCGTNSHDTLPHRQAATACFDAVIDGDAAWSWVRWQADSTLDAETETAVISGQQATEAVWNYMSRCVHVQSVRNAVEEEKEDEDADEEKEEHMRDQQLACHYCGAAPGVQLLLHRRPIWEDVLVETAQTVNDNSDDNDENEDEPFVASSQSDSRSADAESDNTGVEARVGEVRSARGTDDDEVVDADVQLAAEEAATADETSALFQHTPVKVETASLSDLARSPSLLPASTTPPSPLPSPTADEDGSEIGLPPSRSPTPRTEKRLAGYRLERLEITFSFLAHDRFHTHHADCPWRDGLLSAVIDTHSSSSTSLLPKPMDFTFEWERLHCSTSGDDDRGDALKTVPEATDKADIIDDSEGREADELVTLPDSLPPAPRSCGVAVPTSSMPHEAADETDVCVRVRFQRDEVACLLNCWGRSEEQERANPRAYLSQPLPALLHACRRDGSLFTAPAHAGDTQEYTELENFLAQLDEDDEGVSDAEGVAMRRGAEESNDLTPSSALMHHAVAGESVGNVLALIQRARSLVQTASGLSAPSSPGPETDTQPAGHQAALDAATQYLRARATITPSSEGSHALNELFATMQSTLDRACVSSAPQKSEEGDDDATAQIVTRLIHAEYGPALLPQLTEVRVPLRTDGGDTLPAEAAATEDNTAVTIVPTTLAMGLRTPSLLTSDEQARVRAWLSTHVHTPEQLCATSAKTAATPSAGAAKSQPVASPLPAFSSAQSTTRPGAQLNPHATPFAPHASSHATTVTTAPPSQQPTDNRNQVKGPRGGGPSPPPPPTATPRSARDGVLGAGGAVLTKAPAPHTAASLGPTKPAGGNVARNNTNSTAASSTRPSAGAIGSRPAPVFGQLSGGTPTPTAFEAVVATNRLPYTYPPASSVVAPVVSSSPFAAAAPATVLGGSGSGVFGSGGPGNTRPPAPFSMAASSGGFGSVLGRGSAPPPVLPPSALLPTPSLSSPPVLPTAPTAVAMAAKHISAPQQNPLSVLSTSALVGTPSTSFRSILDTSSNQSDASPPANPSPMASFANTSHASPSPALASHTAVGGGGGGFGASAVPRPHLLATPAPLSSAADSMRSARPAQQPSSLAGSPGGATGFGAFAQSSVGRGFTFQAPAAPAAPTATAAAVLTPSRAGAGGGENNGQAGTQPTFGFGGGLAAARPTFLSTPTVPLSGSAISGAGAGFGRPSVFGSSGGTR